MSSMILESVTLSDFRIFKTKKIQIDPSVTVIVGPNAVGKTTILEAISYFSSGKSFRALKDRDVIRDAGELARIIGNVLQGKEKYVLEVVITTGSVLGRQAPYKRLLVDKLGKQLATFVGRLPVVLFWPEDLSIIIGSPSLRRKTLDRVLLQADASYHRAVLSYERALRSRNRLLQMEKNGVIVDQIQYGYWNTVLIENGQYINLKRRSFIEFTNTTPVPREALLRMHLQYDDSQISVSRLAKYAFEEKAAGATLVGPHRDDFSILMQKDGMSQADLARYGSRGEQRLGVLWLKLAELSFLENRFGFRPLLLLDDIFSELDEKNRQTIADVFEQQQTIITTTDSHYFRDIKLDKRRSPTIITL